jgi:hypothetical protein
MTSRPEFEIVSDPTNNRVSIRFRGHVTAEAMKNGREQVDASVTQVKPQFTVLTDLSELESMELDCVGELTRTMDLFRVHHVGTVVRIIPDPNKDIGFNILSIIHYRGGAKVVTCENMAEAERVLAT